MPTQELTLKMRRHRKVMLALPILVLPFTTLLFWALGGGKGAVAKAAAPQGLNLKLPSTVVAGTKEPDKMGFYEQAQKDSLKLVMDRKSDPYSSQNPANVETSVNELKIQQRLATLQSAVNKPEPVYTPAPDNLSQRLNPRTNISRVEDPELKQMSTLLEKILEIQHPERLKEKEDTVSINRRKFLAVPAIVDGKQKVTQGTVVRLKLLDTIRLNGEIIPKGQLVYGTSNLFNQRLTVNIKNIRLGYRIIPVDLTVFDMTDGLEGICVPEAATGDALKDGSVSAAQDLQFMNLDPSLTGQLTSAGLNTAKGLFSKKLRLVKGKLKDGHQVLLRDNSNKLNQNNRSK